MKEDRGWRLLEQFPPLEYLTAARANGRADLAPSIKRSVVEVRNQIQSLRQEDNGDLSEALVAALDLAERVLESEHLIGENGGVARYAPYINQRTLNWSLRTNGRRSLAEVTQRCWHAVLLLAQDLMNFEMRSILGVEKTHARCFDRTIAERRIQAFIALRDQALEIYPEAVVPTASNRPPTAWRTYAEDHSRDLALIYLTAFPQSDHHDEFAFIRTLHITETCLWGVLASLKAAMDRAYLGDLANGTSHLEEGKRFASILLPLFQALKSTLGEEQFMGFREATGDSSAIQSRAYNTVEALLVGFDQVKIEKIQSHIPELLDLLYCADPRFITLSELAEDLAQTSSEHAGPYVARAKELIKALRAWYAIHLGSARHALPADLHGTGGTEGIRYLEARYQRGIYSVATETWRLPLSTGSLTAARPILYSLA